MTKVTAEEREAAEAFHDFVEGFKDNMESLVENAAGRLYHHGYNVDEPAEIWDINFALWLPITGPDSQEYTAEFQIVNALEYEGFPDGAYGLNFMLTVSEWEGKVLADFAPYNFSDRCWIDFRHEDEVEDRWEIFKRNDPTEIILSALA